MMMMMMTIMMLIVLMMTMLTMTLMITTMIAIMMMILITIFSHKKHSFTAQYCLWFQTAMRFWSCVLSDLRLRHRAADELIIHQDHPSKLRYCLPITFLLKNTQWAKTVGTGAEKTE